MKGHKVVTLFIFIFDCSKRLFYNVAYFVTGSLVGQMKFAQFTGTVQVMKAVSNHMVLTFCENLPGSQLFSIILSRKPDTLSMDVSFHRCLYHISFINFNVLLSLSGFIFSCCRICKVYALYLIVVGFRLYRFEKYAMDQHQCTVYRLCLFL